MLVTKLRLFLAAACSAVSMNAVTLYEVGLAPNLERNQDAILYRLDAASQKLVGIRLIARDPALVFVDLERSKVVVASPNPPSQVTVVDGRAPESGQQTLLPPRA